MPKDTEVKKNPEVIAGLFLLFTGILMIITLLTDFKFLNALSSLSEDIKYLSENHRILHINSLLWIASGILMIISASALIAVIVPHHSFLGYLQGFSLFLAAVMFCIGGMKGLTINELLMNFRDLELTDPVGLKSSILSLVREKDNYLITAYNLTGLSLFIFGIFSFITLKIPVIIGILATLTGILIPVFTLLIPESIPGDLSMISACFMFFIITVRFFFKGLQKKDKRKRRKVIDTENNETSI